MMHHGPAFGEPREFLGQNMIFAMQIGFAANSPAD